jgi:hypothetical protein
MLHETVAAREAVLGPSRHLVRRSDLVAFGGEADSHSVISRPSIAALRNVHRARGDSQFDHYEGERANGRVLTLVSDEKPA